VGKPRVPFPRDTASRSSEAEEREQARKTNSFGYSGEHQAREHEEAPLRICPCEDEKEMHNNYLSPNREGFTYGTPRRQTVKAKLCVSRFSVNLPRGKPVGAILLQGAFPLGKVGW